MRDQELSGWRTIWATVRPYALAALRGGLAGAAAVIAGAAANLWTFAVWQHAAAAGIAAAAGAVAELLNRTVPWTTLRQLLTRRPF